jgi:hypothetical protein
LGRVRLGRAAYCTLKVVCCQCYLWRFMADKWFVGSDFIRLSDDVEIISNRVNR